MDKKELKNFVEYLTSGEIEHGFNITKQLLKEKGLDIKDIPETTNKRLINLMNFLPEGVSYI